MTMMAILMMPAFSSQQVDSLIVEDARDSLDAIEVKLDELSQLKGQLQIIDLHLGKKASGETIYIRFDKIVGAVVVSAIIAGTSTVYFPPGMRAMIAANLTVRGVKSGLIVLKDKDANKFISDIAQLKLKITASQKSLQRQAQFYCKTAYDHDLCF